MSGLPLLSVESLSKRYGARIGCADVSFDLEPGEVLAVVGESGSGKSTLLSCLATELMPDSGRVLYRGKDGEARDILALGEAERRLLLRTDWGFIRQDARRGCACPFPPAAMSGSG